MTRRCVRRATATAAMRRVLIAATGLAVTAVFVVASGAASPDPRAKGWKRFPIRGLCDGPITRCSVAVRAINDRGVMVGNSGISPGKDVEYHATIWRRGRAYDLGTLGGTHSLATEINDRGDAVGWSYTRRDLQHAVVWRDGRILDLGVLARRYKRGDKRTSEAWDINNRGQVVGWSVLTRQRKSYTLGFLWWNGRMSVLPPLPGDTQSGASAINDRGQIVGWSAPSFHAVLWENGRARDLGVETDFGGAAINDRGDIVTSTGRLLVNGKRTNLCARVRSRCSANAINDARQIVGYVAPPANSLFGDGVLWDGARTTRFTTTHSLSDIDNRARMVSTDQEGHGIPDRAFLWIPVR